MISGIVAGSSSGNTVVHGHLVIEDGDGNLGKQRRVINQGPTMEAKRTGHTQACQGHRAGQLRESQVRELHELNCESEVTSNSHERVISERRPNLETTVTILSILSPARLLHK